MIIVDVETTGLNPFESKIICIQTKRGNHICIRKEWKAGELAVISDFLDFLRTVSGDEIMLGYNNLKFDVPFIAQRLSAHGEHDRDTYNLLYNKKWLDLYQFLGDDYRSMDSWLRMLGLSKSTSGIRGKDVPQLYMAKKYDLIERYIVDELHTCEKLFQELILRYPAFFEGRI